MAELAAKIAAINARIARLNTGGGGTTPSASSSQCLQATPCTQSVLSAPVGNNVSEIGDSKYGSEDSFGENSTVKSDASLSTAIHASAPVATNSNSSSDTTTITSREIKSGARVLWLATRIVCISEDTDPAHGPSEVAEDLYIVFLDAKRRHWFPRCGITVKATSNSTYDGVKFIECTFDAYEGTTLDDCVLEDVIFTKCHFRGTSIIKLVAKGVRFTGCVFGQTHFDGVKLIEDAVFLDDSFAFERVIRGTAADNTQSARISAIHEFEVIENSKSQQPRQHGWADDKVNNAVQGDGQLVEAPVYAGWENQVIKAAASGDLLSFEEPVDFEEAEGQARSRELEERNGVIVPKNPNWNRQFIRKDTNTVKLIDREAEDAANAKTFAPTNFVTLDFDADPDTRKEEITDECVIGKREYYGTKNNKAKHYWGEKKAEQQQTRRRNIAGAPHFY